MCLSTLRVCINRSVSNACLAFAVAEVRRAIESFNKHVFKANLLPVDYERGVYARLVSTSYSGSQEETMPRIDSEYNCPRYSLSSLSRLGLYTLTTYVRYG